MKKFIPLFIAAVFSLTAFSCQSDDDYAGDYIDYDTYPVVYDLNNVNFELINNTFMVTRTFDNVMISSDVILVYMQDGSSSGSPIWRPIPTTLYLSDGNEVDYDFDFSIYDIAIYAGGTFNLGGTSYVNNKTFRLVFVPASFANKNSDNQVDYNDYESVIAHFNIDDTNVGTL